MLKIWKQKKTEAEAQRLKPKGAPSRIRLQKDISEIVPSKDTDITFPNTSDQTRFNMTYRPPTGYYQGGEFRFSFEISDNYPHEAPKDPLNKEAANVMREDKGRFARMVVESMSGYSRAGVNYDNVLDKNGGNDHGFVFKRGRVPSASKAIQALVASKLSVPSNSTHATNNNENTDKEKTANGSRGTPASAQRNRKRSTDETSRLDFPEPKRRLTEQVETANSVQDISVPLRKPPQPTPLISRTRTRMFAETPKREANGRLIDDGGRSVRRVAGGRRKSTMGGRRRSTFSMRGKRASSIGGGFKAVPHESVGSCDFYRHISPELPEPIRLRQLLAWSARRTAVPMDDWPEEIPDPVKKLLSDVLREAVDDMHSAFEKGEIATSWYHRPVDAEAEGVDNAPLQPHPENLANEKTRDALKSRISALQAENDAWVGELRRASSTHAKTLDRLPRPVQALAAGCEPSEPLSRSAESIDWAVLDDDKAKAYVESSAGIDEELRMAEASIERAVQEIQVQLDAFRLDVHRASGMYGAVEEATAKASGALGFALTQRRAKARALEASRPGACGSDRQQLKQQQQPDGHSDSTRDSTRDLLRTLSASLFAK
ncbi:hypothetical protein GGF39_002333 [Coemansia sp. RSA 1721]|nr:hypothetical protein GGF39_002333 [Coemansia sp. RSA 1721]